MKHKRIAVIYSIFSKRFLFFFISVLFLSTFSRAGEGTWVHYERLKDIGIGLDYSIFEPSRVGQDFREYQNRRGIIKLDYARNEQSDLLNADVDWRVSVGISYMENGVEQVRELKINNFAEGAQYMDYEQLQLSVLETGYSVYVRSILAEYKLPNGTWQTETNLQTSQYIPHDIDFKLSLDNELWYRLDDNATDCSALDFDNQAFRVNWSYVEGAEWYDLEWVFIDKESLEYAQVMSSLSNGSGLESSGNLLPFDLKEPTRVRVWGTHYVLDRTYPPGVIFFRVRSVSQFAESSGVDEQIKLGSWTYFYNPSTLNQSNFASGTIVRHELTAQTAFEPEKNWLYGVAYAEEGKSVSSLSYFDGSNRARQSLTYNTSDNVTLVGESKFDYEGRQTVSVIPAPISGRNLLYQTGFNLMGPGDIFDENDIEEQVYAGNSSANPPLSTLSGAARYFSPSNDFTDDLYRSAIPDAEGYVYSQTVYRNDGSGRIELVGGIGEDFKVSGDHAVRTYYGSPTLVELKRLFGENVSDQAEGYRKEMVRDANGQYSVTYYDKRGHVIATGLSGNSPTNLIELEDQAPVEITSSLNDNNQLIGLYTKSSEHTFLNGIENNVLTLNYDLQGIVNQITSQAVTVGNQVIDFGTLCSTCRYDLTIEIKDANGAYVNYTTGGVEGYYSANIDPSGACYSNGTAVSLSGVELTYNLAAIGEYRIIKTLRVDTESMSSDFEAQLAAEGLLDAEAFINNYVSLTDLSGCFSSCDGYCEAIKKHEYELANGVGSWASFWAGMSASEQEAYLASCIATACSEDEMYDSFESDDNSPANQVNPFDYACESSRMQMLQQISPGGVFYDDVNSSFWQNFASQYGSSVTFTISGNSVTYSLAELQNPANYTEEIAVLLLPLHREYCHLSLCDDWATSMLYSSGLGELIQASTSFGTSLYNTPYSTAVVVGPDSYLEDPFLDMDFNNFSSVNNQLADRVDTYLDLNPITCGGSTYNSGNLWDYVDAYVNCLAAENANLGVYLSSDYYNYMRKLQFKGMYDNIKQEIIRDYKLTMSPPCVYQTDDNRVFVGPQTQAEMESAVDNALSGISNSSSCYDMALSNVSTWLNGLPAACLEALEPNDYDPSYTAAELQGGLNAGHLEQLFYDYTMATCSSNTFGWFYDPDPANDASQLYAGETEYTSVVDMLTNMVGCGASVLNTFEVSPPPVSGTTTYMNQTFDDCFLEYIEMINDGLSELNTNPQTVTGGSPCVGNCQESTINVSSSGLYPVLSSGQCNTTGNIMGVYKFYRSLDGSGNYTYWVGAFEGACRIVLYTAQGDLFNTVSNPSALLSLSNPVRHAVYNNQTNVVTFTATFANQGTQTVYILASDLSCLLYASDFTQTQSLSDFGFDVTLPDYEQDCIESTLGQAAVEAENIYNDLLNDLRNEFLASMGTCMNSVQEDFQISYHLKESQYTLYYYDLAGNLVQTVPPQGVDILSSVQASSGANPNHKMETRYKYNGLNTLIAQYTPDGGHSDFHVDKLYRIRYSQNARQAEERKASYSYYDPLGRVVEAGEFLLPLTAINNQYGYLASIVEEAVLPPGARKLDHTITYYEDVYTADPALAASFEGGNQENLRNAIGAVYHIQADYNLNGTMITGTGIETVTAYSYDPHKNLKQVISANYQLVALGEQYKKTEYEYDLISGNVEEVIYQKGEEDEYRHAYHYDANNRLIRSFTSDDGGVNWEMDAKYFYYLHGSLARVETGHDKVQGTDYAYNLQGWLKGVNSATLSSARDLGKDGQSTGINKYVGADSYGYQLGYFDGDYQSIGNVESFAGTANLTGQNVHPISGQATMGSLYNGNITHMVTAMRKLDESILEILGNNYQYDQLQRIKSVDAYSAAQLNTNNSFFGATLHNGGAYQERYSFDKNGNLKTLTRNGSGKDANGSNIPLAMDNFQYNYYNDFSNTGTTLTNPEHVNRLASVDDQQLTDSYTTDINPGQVANNYQYDKSGQLIKDIQEGIEKIEWTVTGKVKRITFTAASNKKELKFVYDPMDMRVAKIEYLNNDHSSINYEYYSYDAQGNVMATYERIQNLEEDNLKLLEHHIYGAKRLGVQNSGKELKQRNVVSVPQGGSIDIELSEDIVWGSVQGASYDKTQRIVEDKRYELANHLGNVLVVVTDRKVPLNSTTYTADVVSFSDYSPYGVQLDKRHQIATEGKYKYGYQGSEKDDEIKGEGNSYTTEFRLLDPRIGRWLSLDPMATSRVSLTPYNSMSNNPISRNDQKGDVDGWIGKKDEAGNTNWKYDANVSSKEQLPSGYTEFVNDGYTYQGINGKYVRLGTDEHFEISEATFKASQGEFEEGRYYRIGKYGFEECGAAYVDAVPGYLAFATFDLTNEMNAMRINEELTLENDFQHSIIENSYYENAQREYMMSTNLFGIAYQVSPISSCVDSYSYIKEGSYAMAAFTFFLEFAPMDEVVTSIGKGYRSFSSFKRANGAAGQGMAWHHIVEQHADNIARFGPEMIHNTNNLVKLPHGAGSLHQKVTNHYNSFMPGTSGRVRDYVKSLSYNDQLKYGLETLKRFGWNQ